MPPSHQPERRSQPRPAVQKNAVILVGDNAGIPCIVRNIHSGGAELNIAVETELPGRFLLHVPSDGLAYRIVVCWRKSERVGVEFKSSEPWQE
jgi:NADPH-dependent ferric siderophore reductase